MNPNGAAATLPYSRWVQVTQQIAGLLGVFFRRLAARRGGKRAMRRMLKEVNSLHLTIRFEPITA